MAALIKCCLRHWLAVVYYGTCMKPVCVFSMVVLLQWFSAIAAVGSDSRTHLYRLMEGSILVDDCMVCDRPSIPMPVRGSFKMTLTQENPISTSYSLSDIHLYCGTESSASYVFNGTGRYQSGGEVVLRQDVTMTGQMDGAPIYFTNASSAVTRSWPVVELDLMQTNGTYTHTISIHLLAAPFQEIWFSTLNGITPGCGCGPSLHYGPGDLLSSAGNRVMPLTNLVSLLQLKSIPDGLKLDAVNVKPGGELFFALDQDLVSSNLGPIQQGDLLSNRGLIKKKNQELTSKWGIMPIVPDFGLESIQVMDDGRILLAIKDPAFSETQPHSFQPGNIYDNAGQIYKTGAELYARFSTKGDYGLRAFFVWPSGEVWFTPSTNFEDSALGTIHSGDLISNQGYIVYKNLELVSAFSPLEDLANFGLNSLYVVTDAGPEPGSCRITSFSKAGASQGVQIQWESTGRVFQLLQTDVLNGSFNPASPLMVDTSYQELSNGTAKTNSFYRIRQW